jgi:hypothetical protein|eukprot:COSAG03_NODE_30_length_18664_cov_5.381524_12_plen_369_part_00
MAEDQAGAPTAPTERALSPQETEESTPLNTQQQPEEHIHELVAGGETKVVTPTTGTPTVEPSPEPEPQSPASAAEPARSPGADEPGSAAADTAIEIELGEPFQGSGVGSGIEPLHDAAATGDARKVEQAISQLGAAVGEALVTTNAEGWMPVHYAAINPDPKSLRLLLEAGGSVNAQTVEGQTCLHFASLWGHTQIAKLLLECSANVKQENEFGATPLHWCAEYGANEVAELLLDADADPNARDSAGRTPLHVAAEASHVGVAMVLLSAGAEQDIVASNGKTAADLATRQVAALLEQKCTDFPFYEWLSARGLEQFAGVFSAHAIDFDVLLHLEEKHLAEMDIPLGARMKIMSALHDPAKPRVATAAH